MNGVPRTGVRFVFSNSADPSRADEYSAWYDTYEAGILRPGFLADAYRFENPRALANDDDPRYAAIYDIVTLDPAKAWPDTERSPDYPTYLFDDPRSTLVAPALRASYALVGSLETPRSAGALTGTYIVLSNGADEASRAQWAADVLEIGLFYAASWFRIIEGYPDPPDWLEVFETDQEDPLAAYPRSLEALAPRLPAESIRQRNSGAFRLVSVHPPSS
jgi:hypothetical protein